LKKFEFNGAKKLIDKKSKILQLFLEEFRLHPGATLIDYYKLFFQACFGSGHMVRFPQQAYAFLEKEWLEVERLEPVLWQNVEYLDSFVRVNFIFLKHFNVSLSDFFQIFVQGTRQKVQMKKDEFEEHWNLAQEILQTGPFFKKLDRQEASQIERRVHEQQFMVHHSEFYCSFYHPHYRLFPKPLFEEWVKTKL